MKFKKIKVKECASINKKSINPATLSCEFINYYDIGSVGSGTLKEISIIKKDKAPSRARRCVEHGDSILATVRPGNKTYYYFRDCSFQDIVSTGYAVLTPIKEISHPRFLYYAITSNDFIAYLVQNEKGATYPAVDEKIITNGEIPFPPFDTQERIANILSAYDDLIENNQKQIKLLEEAAQRLYKEWFVDFRFPGYEKAKFIDGIPEGWKKEPVGSIIDNISRKKQIKATDYLDVGAIPIVDQSKIFIAGYTNDNEAIINIEKPVIVFGDHTRILKYVQFPFAKGADGTQLIVSNKTNMPQSLFYCSLIAVDLSNYHYARHFKYLKAETILVPTKDIADRFDVLVATMFSMIQNLRDISSKLTQARDRLLPKLMSGEIEV